MAYQPLDLGTSAGAGDGEPLRVGGIKINSNFVELYEFKAPIELRYIDNKSKLPTAVSGAITLVDDYTYLFTKNIDLLGDRLISGDKTTIIGFSSENCSITSTGLGSSTALITSVHTTPIRHITFKDVGTCFDFDGVANTMALDWTGVNVENVPDMGTIKDFTNFIFSKGAFISSNGLKIDGEYNTLSIDNSLLLGNGSAGDIVKVLSTATCTIRTRIVYSSVVAFGSTNGLNVDAGSIIPNEAFILDTVNFSGGSNYLPGLDETSNKSLFVNCNGIKNTFVNAQLYMQGNATPTTIASSNTFYKILGTTTASPENSKFTHSDNRLTCDAAINRKYLIQCTLSFTSGNNKECEFGFYDSKLSGIRIPSRTKTTSDGVGKSSPITLICVVDYIQGDFLEIHSANNTDTTSITVTQMNFVITEIG